MVHKMSVTDTAKAYTVKQDTVLVMILSGLFTEGGNDLALCGNETTVWVSVNSTQNFLVWIFQALDNQDSKHAREIFSRKYQNQKYGTLTSALFFKYNFEWIEYGKNLHQVTLKKSQLTL